MNFEEEIIKLREVQVKIFELFENIIWMLNVDSSYNVQNRLKELEKIKKRLNKNNKKEAKNNERRD